MPKGKQNKPSFNKDEYNDKLAGKERQGNRSQRRGSKFSKKEGSGYMPTKGSNNIAWHSPDAELLRRAAEVSWSYQTGEIFDMDAPIVEDTFGLDTTAKTSQAGIMVIRDMVSVGGIGMWNPALWERNYMLPTYNAANSLLTEMRSKARIRNTYDAPDVLMLMIAMANIYAGIFLARRLAGTVRMYTYKNQYMPEELIDVQGFDAEWFKKNQYRFVTELNVIISEINKIYIPNKMHLFELINQRFSNYYTEGSDVRDQLYLITPAFLSAIDMNPTTDYASHVVPVMCIPGTVTSTIVAGTKYDNAVRYTGDQLLNVLRFMVSQVVNHDATPDITGDMENCFGTGERFYLPACNPDDVVVPVFDEEILETIHNMSWSDAVRNAYVTFDTTAAAPYWNTHGPFTTFQNPSDNRIGTWDYFKSSTNSLAYKRYFRFENSLSAWLDVHRDPNPEKTFEITRLKNVTCYRTEYNNDLYINVMFSTDLICSVEFYQFAVDSNQQRFKVRWNVKQVAVSDRSNFLLDAQMQAFHYRPLRGLVDGSAYAPENACWLLGETDIFAKGDFQMYKNMNRISLLSLLGAYNNM